MANPDIENLKDLIVNILRLHGVKKAALFGSVARGEQSPESDIDILVEFGPHKSLLDLVGLKLDLEDLLKRKVDVITYRSLNPLIRDKILHEQEVIFG